MGFLDHEWFEPPDPDGDRNPFDDMTPEEIAGLDELMGLIAFIQADTTMPFEFIMQQPEHVTGFIRMGKN